MDKQVTPYRRNKKLFTDKYREVADKLQYDGNNEKQKDYTYHTPHLDNHTVSPFPSSRFSSSIKVRSRPIISSVQMSHTWLELQKSVGVHQFDVDAETGT